MKTAVIYYSRSGVTKSVAEKIVGKFGSELIFVEPEKNYGGYARAVVKAVGELITRENPKFKNKKADFSAFDMIFVGFPVWCGTIPRFFEEYLRTCDFSGKKIIPFITAGANGEEKSLAALENLFPESEISDHLFKTVPNRADENAWLQKIEEKYFG